VDDQAVLKLQIHRRLPFLPPARIKVPKARKVEVESIINRYLSEWPPTSEANVVPSPSL
jgi:hypothetical protein